MAGKTVFKFFVLFVFSAGLAVSGYSQSKKLLKVGDLNGGIDTRITSTNSIPAVNSYKSSVQGLSLRYQSSVLLNHFQDTTRRFHVGDILSAEVGAGLMQSNDPVQKIPFWFSYSFEMGACFLYRLSTDVDLNVNLALLRFSRDYITTNISGSGIQFRLRYKSLIAEGGLISRQLRIIGFAIPYFNPEEEKNLNQFGLRYLLSGQTNIGVRVEYLNKTKSNNQEGFLNFRAYYGRYF